MAQQLSNVTIQGVLTLADVSGTAYYSRVRVGGGSPNNATGAKDVYITSNLEVDGDIYVDNDVRMTGTTEYYLQDNNALAASFKQGAADRYLTFVTTNGGEKVVIGRKSTYNPTSGFHNAGISTQGLEETRSVDFWKYPLGTGSAAGGIVAISNPTGVRMLVLDTVLDVYAGSTSAVHANVGIASGAAVSAKNIFCGVNISAVETRNNVLSGTDSPDGYGVTWLPSQHFTITPSGLVNATTLSGHVYIATKELE